MKNVEIYTNYYKTKIDGVLPVIVDFAESLKLPTEDFELTVNV